MVLPGVCGFCAGLSGKDARLLMGHGAMTGDKLRKVVHTARHRDLAAFDPIAEAFKVRPCHTVTVAMSLEEEMLRLSSVAEIRIIRALSDRRIRCTYALRAFPLTSLARYSKAHDSGCAWWLPRFWIRGRGAMRTWTFWRTSSRTCPACTASPTK